MCTHTHSHTQSSLLSFLGNKSHLVHGRPHNVHVPLPSVLSHSEVLIQHVSCVVQSCFCSIEMCPLFPGGNLTTITYSHLTTSFGDCSSLLWRVTVEFSIIFLVCVCLVLGRWKHNCSLAWTAKTIKDFPSDFFYPSQWSKLTSHWHWLLIKTLTCVRADISLRFVLFQAQSNSPPTQPCQNQVHCILQRMERRGG